MKIALLLAAYGAANPEGKLGLAEFERRCRMRFPRLPLRWAFTSPRQRERLVAQGKKSDSLAKALQRLSHEQFDAVLVQPLQLIPGSEYGEVQEAVREFAGSGTMKCLIGEPLLPDKSRLPEIASLLAKYAAEKMSPDGCAVFMAHGAKHPAGSLFADLAEELEKINGNVFLGAMSSPPGLKNILPRLAGRPTCLFPLLSVAGVHTFREMAGDAPDSWKIAIEKSGSICVPVLKGLIEKPEFADIWLNNVEKLLTDF